MWVRSCSFVALCAIFWGQVYGKVVQVSMNDYLTKINGHEESSAVVFPFQGSENDSGNKHTIGILTKISDELSETFQIHIFALYCEKSNEKICSNDGRQLALIHNGEVNGHINVEDLKATQSDIAVIVQKLYGSELIKEIKAEDAEQFHIDNKNMHSLVVFVCEIGSQDHYLALKYVKTFFDDEVVCFIVSDVSILGIDEEKFNGVKAFEMHCDENDDKCMPVGITTASLAEEDFKEFTEQILEEGKNDALSFIDFLTKKVQADENVFILFAGKGKNEKADLLSMEIKKKIPCRIAVATMDTPHTGLLGHFYENNKIFATYRAAAKDHELLFDIGALMEETFEEFESLWQDAVEEPRMPQAIHNSEMYIDDETSIMDTLDDPMAFAVHTSKKMRNFYLYDYKTMSRLTDKTFPALVNSDKYGVILFTLEFNARALATLSLYKEIFDSLAEKGDNSFMHRVECFDWPDVCAKMNVTTAPRMFFHKPNNNQLREYMGMWTRKGMENAILRQSMDDIITVNTEAEIKEKLPEMPAIKVIIGIFHNDKECEVFREAVMKNSDVLFIQAVNEAAKFFAKEVPEKVNHGSLLAYEDMEFHDILPTYETEQDIFMFLKHVFNPIGGQLFELKITNYNEVLSDKKPLFIHFRNASNPSDKKWMKLLESFADDKTLDSNEESAIGLSIAEKYNIHQYPAIAYFDKKGSVFAKALSGMNTDKLMKWAEQCNKGNVKSIYELSTEPWKPRLDGYDFLQKMKDDNTYPVNFRNPKLHKEMQEEKAGGRLKQKVAKAVADELKASKKVSHTEL